MSIRQPEPREYRQILPLVMLMMMAILGIAALAVDGSNLYSQHRRWQADLDVGVTDAAGQLSSGTTYTATLQQAMSRLTQTLAQDGYPVSGPTITTTVSGSDLNYGGCFTRSGITLCNPPVSTPFQGLSHYVQGTISTTVPGFFGNVIGLGKMHLNVQAVAKHTGSVTQSPYTILALDTNSTNTNNCPIKGNGSSGGLYVGGSIRSNDVNCKTSGFQYTVTGSSQMSGAADPSGLVPIANGLYPMTGTLGTSTGLNPTTDPYPPIPLPATVVNASSSPLIYSGITNPICQSEVQQYLGSPPPQTASDYYVFGGPSGTYVSINWNLMPNSGNYYLLPGCDPATGTVTVPGVFYFTGRIQNAGSHVINIESFSSTVVLPDVNSALAGDSFDMTTNAAGTFALQAPGPGSGPYAGIALTQLRTTDSTTISGLNCGSGGSSLSNIKLQGGGTTNSPVHTIGIVDVPCASLKTAGTSGFGNTSTTCTVPDVEGAIVVNDWTNSGGGFVCVLYDSQAHGFTGGGVLVY